MFPLVDLYLQLLTAWARSLEALTRPPGIAADGWDYNPVTTWFSPQVNIGTGVPSIERDVYRQVASPGKQLGIVTDALLAVADGKPDDPAVQRLRFFHDEIESVKQRRKAVGPV